MNAVSNSDIAISVFSLKICLFYNYIPTLFINATLSQKNLDKELLMKELHAHSYKNLYLWYTIFKNTQIIEEKIL